MSFVANETAFNKNQYQHTMGISVDLFANILISPGRQ